MNPVITDNHCPLCGASQRNEKGVRSHIGGRHPLSVQLKQEDGIWFARIIRASGAYVDYWGNVVGSNKSFPMKKWSRAVEVVGDKVMFAWKDGTKATMTVVPSQFVYMATVFADGFPKKGKEMECRERV
jgi:hypothetical protein